MICGLKIQQSTSMHSKVGFRGFCTKTKQLCLSFNGIQARWYQICFGFDCTWGLLKHGVYTACPRPPRITSCHTWRKKACPLNHNGTLASCGVAPGFTHFMAPGSAGAPRYCPILPMVLVNGAEGIGVGWSTSIPNYNPRDIIRRARGKNCLDVCFHVFSVCHVSVSGK